MSGTGASHGMQQTRKATASGWIGSVLEYYDFFIYATAASLIFPQIFCPSTDPKVAIVASLATYGVGYVETLVFRDKSSYAFYTAPRVGDDVIQFRPATNLAQLAVTLADSLDQEGSVVTGPIAQDQLAGSLCSMQVAGAYLETTGCLSFVVDSTDAQGSFTVFVAEFPDETAMEELVEGAHLEGQLPIASRQRLILFVAQPSFDDDTEAEVDLAHFESFADAALKESAPTGWHLR